MKWRNLNTYLALFAISLDARAIPAFAGMLRSGFKTLAMALEHSPDTREGRNTTLHAPAAAQWLRIAGDELSTACADGSRRFPAGDLWSSQGGSERCDSVRLQFWRSRLTDLGY